jgi:hypothetical protein
MKLSIIIWGRFIILILFTRCYLLFDQNLNIGINKKINPDSHYPTIKRPVWGREGTLERVRLGKVRFIKANTDIFNRKNLYAVINFGIRSQVSRATKLGL